LAVLAALAAEGRQLVLVVLGLLVKEIMAEMVQIVIHRRREVVVVERGPQEVMRLATAELVLVATA